LLYDGSNSKSFSYLLPVFQTLQEKEYRHIPVLCVRTKGDLGPEVVQESKSQPQPYLAKHKIVHLVTAIGESSPRQNEVFEELAALVLKGQFAAYGAMTRAEQAWKRQLGFGVVAAVFVGGLFLLSRYWRRK